MAKQLLVDTMTFRLALKESTAGGKIIAHGRFALADVATANGRVYKRSLWVREIQRLMEGMKARRIFGEADHPSDGRTKLTRVAHILTNLELTEDGEIIGTAEIIDTTGGKELKAIIAAGGGIGVSSRGYGSISKDSDGNDVVEEDYQLDTFDFVVDPAQGSAYPEFHAEGKAKPEGTMKVEAAKTEVPKAEAESEKGAGCENYDDASDTCADPKAEDGEKDDINSPASATEESTDVKKAIDEAVAKVKEEIRAEVLSMLASHTEVKSAVVATVVAEEKDTKIKDLEEQIKALSFKVGQAQLENVALSKAVKDLGFKLYVTKTLAGHPKLESVLESFGDVTLVENVEALQKLVAPHKEQLKTARTEEVEGSRKLIASKDGEIARLSQALKTASDANRKVVAERDEAVKTAQRVSLGLYLERKIAGNPHASAIRVKFKDMTEKSKATVDGLVEAFNVVPIRRSGDHERIRARLKGQGQARTSTLVEDSVRDTGSQIENGNAAMDMFAGIQMDAATINRLAGIRF